MATIIKLSVNASTTVLLDKIKRLDCLHTAVCQFHFDNVNRS